jgi:diguanylate cyclase (GGDEF)-like protein/PAS domain S-box-containing protein
MAPILVEARPNARRSLDFVHDQFACGRRFRILNIVDDVTRECLAAIPDTSISGRRVARELTALIELRGKPGMIVSDNGTEFTSNAMLAWARPRFRRSTREGAGQGRGHDQNRYQLVAARLEAGELIMGLVRNFEPPVRAFLQPQGVLAVLVVPIFVDGRWWGQIGFDHCKDERAWSAADIDVVKMLAALIGGSLARARHVKTLADAARIIEGSPTILFRLAPEEGAPLIYVSDNVKRLGYRAEDMFASPQLWQQALHADDRRSMMASIRDIIEGRSEYSHREFRWTKPDGSLVWLDGRLTAVRDSAHRLVALEGTGIDIGERKAAEDNVAKLARTDALTILPNRMAFIEQLENAFATAKHGGTLSAVLFLDLDYFKDVNDTLGHPMGDKLLQVVAARLRHQVRESDFVARFGGDEFAVLQAGVSDPEDTAEPVGRTPSHRRSHRSTTTSAMPVLQKTNHRSETT